MYLVTIFYYIVIVYIRCYNEPLNTLKYCLKIMRHLIFIALLFISFQTTSAQAETTELISLPFGIDNKKWEIGWQEQKPELFMYEFVPNGQSVENWKEIITVQFYPALKKLSAADFLNTFLSDLQKSEPGVNIKIISASNDNAVAQWNLANSKTNNDQYELDRVIKGKKGLHMIHYAVKTTDWDESERDKWIKFINQAKVKTVDQESSVN